MSNSRYLQKGVSRRQFLSGSGLSLGAMLLGPSLLSACGDDGGSSASSNSLYFANWPAYIDEEEPTTVTEFAEASGIDFKYTTEYNDNNEYFAKIQPQLAGGKRLEVDMIAPTFWMAGRLIQLGWVEEIPFDKIPNAKNLDSSLKNPTWDPEGKYSLPWQSGFAGIAYNSEVTGRDITKVEDLWDPKFKGKIGLLSEMRDTLGVIGLSQGVDIEKPTAAAFDDTLALVKEQVDNGQVRQFTGNDYMDDLAQGNFAACIGWSGDIAQLQKDNPNLKFVIPESGSTLWSDTMVILKGSPHAAQAAEWMDYVYDPAHAAKITAFVQYVSPVAGVQDELKKLGGEAAALAESPLLFPDDSMKSKLSSFGTLSEKDEESLDRSFAEIAGN
jgi:spermidine/putrescine transport system substrate-binding protein